MRAFAKVFVAAAQCLAASIGAREILLGFGLAGVGYGAGAVYPPAGFFLPGAVLVAIVVFGLA